VNIAPEILTEVTIPVISPTHCEIAHDIEKDAYFSKKSEDPIINSISTSVTYFSGSPSCNANKLTYKLDAENDKCENDNDSR